MANEVMSTLFGVTPESLMAQREQQLQQRALQFAQLDPMQAAQAGFYMAGNRLGGAVGGLLGAEDPELMRVKQRQSLLQGIDLNDPTALREAASKALQSGDNAAASQLAQRALEVEAKKAGIAKDVAAANRERQQAIPADIQTAQRLAGLEQAISQYETAGDEYAPYVKQLKAEREQLLRLTTKEGSKPTVVGVAENTKQPVYSDGTQQFVYAKGPEGQPIKQPYYGGVDRTTAATKINLGLGDVFDKAFNQRNAEEQGKQWDLTGQAYATIPSTRQKLTDVTNLIDQSFSGAGANVKLGAAKLASSLGLPIDVNKASNTEVVEALTTQFAIAELKKNFGSNPAVKDFEAQLKVKPGILQEPKTFKSLVNKLNDGLLAEEIAYRKGEEYRKANKGSISGFNPYIVRAEVTTKLNRLNTLRDKATAGKISADEKAEAIKLQQELR